MPFSSHVVVTFSEFLERRERRRHVAAALEDDDRADVGESAPLTEPIARGVAGVPESPAATDEAGNPGKEAVSVPERAGLPKRVPR
jgi:hypothetical protein